MGHSMPRWTIWVPTISDKLNFVAIYSPIIIDGNEILKPYLNAFRNGRTEKLTISRSADKVTNSLSLDFERTVGPICIRTRQVG